MVTVGGRAVVARQTAIGAVGQRDSADKLAGSGHMAVAARGAGHAQGFGANQPAQGHKAGQRCASVVGLAGGEGQRCRGYVRCGGGASAA